MAGLRLRWYAVRVEGGDFSPVGEGGRMMLEGEVTAARDHRAVALDAFRAVPLASHVFTEAADMAGAVAVCWRRSALLVALGELELSPGEAAGVRFAFGGNLPDGAP